jgi:hypothetical protein
MRVADVSVCVTVISTPGKTAPDWSLTVPEICATAPPCANRLWLSKKKAKIDQPARFIEFSPIKVGVILGFHSAPGNDVTVTTGNKD